MISAVEYRGRYSAFEQVAAVGYLEDRKDRQCLSHECSGNYYGKGVAYLSSRAEDHDTCSRTGSLPTSRAQGRAAEGGQQQQQKRRPRAVHVDRTSEGGASRLGGWGEAHRRRPDVNLSNRERSSSVKSAITAQNMSLSPVPEKVVLFFSACAHHRQVIMP